MDQDWQTECHLQIQWDMKPEKKLPNFTGKNEWPAKSPVLNPVQNFRSIIDKDLVPKTIGTWKKTHGGDEKAKETKYLISRTIAKHVHFLAVPYRTKDVKSPTFFYVLLARKPRQKIFFHLCSKTGTNFWTPCTID